MDLKKSGLDCNKSFKKLFVGVALGGALVLGSGCGSYIEISSNVDLNRDRYCWNHHGWYNGDHWNHHRGHHWDPYWGHHDWHHWNHHWNHHGGGHYNWHHRD